MKKLTKLGILGLCLFCLFITSYGQEATDVSKEIQAVNTSFMEALKSGDADAIVNFYTEDAKVFPPNFETIEGKENIKGMWQAMSESGMPILAFKTVKAEAIGNMAIEEGKYEVSIPDGQVVDKGKYLVVWKKVDGKWLLHLDIFNTSMPAPE